MPARLTLALVALATAATTTATPAQAVPIVPVVSWGSGYVPSEVTIVEGSTLQLVNGDAAQSHDLRSLDTVGGVPLFGSAILGPGGTGEVFGVSALPGAAAYPFNRYPFYCSVHDFMVGNITVVSS